MLLSDRQQALLREYSKDEESFHRLLALFDEIKAAATDEAQEQLLAEHTRYNALFERTNDAVFIISTDGVILNINQYAADLLGYTVDEIRGSYFTEFIFPDSLADAEQKRALVNSGAIPPVYERIFRHKSGVPIYTEINAALIYDENKNPLCIQSIVRDISERKKVEASLRRSEQLYRTFVDYFPNGAVALLDQDLRYIVAGGMGLAEFDLLGTDFEGKHAPETMSQEVLNFFYPLLKAAQKGETNLKELEYSDRIYQINTLPVKNDDGDVIMVMVIAQNVTVRKQIEHSKLEQEKLQIALQKEQELSHLKTQIMMRISHEFRTPLAIILTSSQILERYQDRMPQDRRDNHRMRIHRQIQRLTELLDDISLIIQNQMQPEALSISHFNLRSLCQQLVEKMQATLGSGHILALRTENVEYVHADYHVIEMILTNLLSNALKYSQPQTTVTVDVWLEESNIAFRVSDQGIGISEDEQPHLFDPFFRGSNINEVGGIGLGLSIVKDVVDMYGGTIEVQSVLNEGTTFTVRLPELENANLNYADRQPDENADGAHPDKRRR